MVVVVVATRMPPVLREGLVPEVLKVEEEEGVWLEVEEELEEGTGTLPDMDGVGELVEGEGEVEVEPWGRRRRVTEEGDWVGDDILVIP